jgi:hypothetical protein
MKDFVMEKKVLDFGNAIKIYPWCCIIVDVSHND